MHLTTKMVSVQLLLTLTATVLAAEPTQATEPRPYYMDMASKAMVNYAMRYKHVGVPESVASSQASYAVEQILKQPQATAIVEGAISHVGNNGPTMDPSQMLSLANQAHQMYEGAAKKPGYTNYAQYVRSAAKNFNIAKATDDAQVLIEKYGNGGKQRYPVHAKHAISKANVALAQVTEDPQGQAAYQTAKIVGNKLAVDFGASMPTGIKGSVKRLFDRI